MYEHDCPSCECDFSWSDEALARFAELRTEDSLAGFLFRAYEAELLRAVEVPLVSSLDGPVTITVYDVGISGNITSD